VTPYGAARRRGEQGVAKQVGKRLSDPVRIDMSRSQVVNHPPHVDSERIRRFGHPAQ
jgi:hypothetical protein